MAGLTLGPDYYEELRKTYTEKRDLFLRGLDGRSTNGIWQDVPPMACLERLLTLFQGEKRK